MNRIRKIPMMHWFLSAMMLLLFFLMAEDSYAVDMMGYYPLEDGNIWLNSKTYMEEGQTRTKRSREIISGSLMLDSSEVFILGEMEPECWQMKASALAWDSEGLKLFGLIDCDEGASEVQVFDPPLLYFPRALDFGESQTWSVAGGTEITATLEAMEDVSVPAGTFQDAVRFFRLVEQGGHSEACRSWSVEGIGVVKQECEFTDDGETKEEDSELIAAIAGGMLIGSPLLPEDPLSALDLATVSMDGCGMVINNIVAQGAGGPEFWWASFQFDLQTASWAFRDVGPGVGAVPSYPCEHEGLDFESALTKLGRDDVSGLPEIWMRLPFESGAFGIAFIFSAETLSWDLLPVIQSLE